MSLNSSNNYLSTLVEAGADAQSNLYLVEFSKGAVSIDEKDAMHLSVRCKGFTPPAVNQEEYSVKFLTAQIDRPAAKVKVDRQFSLEFRVDANYEAYKTLLSQQKITFNAAHSFVATDVNTLKDKFFKVSIKTITSGVTSESDIPADKIFEYDHCWISEIEPLKFDSANSKPIEVRLTCKYLEGYDWATDFE